MFDPRLLGSRVHRSHRLQVAFVVVAVVLHPAAPTLAQEIDGSVIVKNLLDRDLLVWVNGEPQGLAPAGGEAEFESVPSGRLSLLASAPGAEGIVASETRDFAPGGTFVWTIYPIEIPGEEKGTTILVVRNRLDRAIDLELGGNAAGRLEPGSARTYPRIASGDVTARVRDTEGRVLYEFSLSLLEGETMVWNVGAEATRPEPMKRPSPSIERPVD
jgi:hypothetical protein